MNDKSIKITLLGESGTGKTVLIERYVDNSYSNNIEATRGASYASRLFDFFDKKIRIDIWDTPGIEKYRPLNKLFYKESDIIIFVYSVDNRNSFEEIKNYWLSDVKGVCGGDGK